MRRFLKQRTRALLICSDQNIQNTLVPIMTGYELYVDYLDNVADGLTRFKAYRHPLVLLDMALAESSPQRLVELFLLVQRDCQIIALAQTGESNDILHRIQEGLFDVLELPSYSTEIRFRIRRAIQHYKTVCNLNFIRMFSLAVLLLIPLLFVFCWYRV